MLKHGDKALENYINSTKDIRKHFIVFSGAEKMFNLELFVAQYGELLNFL